MVSEPGWGAGESLDSELAALSVHSAVIGWSRFWLWRSGRRDTYANVEALRLVGLHDVTASAEK